MQTRTPKNPIYCTNVLQNFTKTYHINHNQKQNMDYQTSRVNQDYVMSKRRKTTRLELGEIVNNNVYPILGDEQMPIFTKITELIGTKQSYYPHFRPKLKQNFTKNKQKNKKMQQQSASYYYNRFNKTSNKLTQPQYSYQNNNNNEQNTLNKFTAKCNLMLQIQDNNYKTDKSRSRALMNYSKVYKNQSKDRFKVKIDKSLIVRFMELSAQKVVIGEKYKKQKNQNIVKSYVISRSSNVKPKTTSHNRYVQPSQQFDIQAWDYN